MAVEAVSSETPALIEVDKEDTDKVNGRMVAHQKDLDDCFSQRILSMLTDQPKPCSFLWGYFDPEKKRRARI
ncbi:MAG: hypothetical protein KFB95_04615 [Simkaniaceae bacterium]|nr:MAG: hypothetical protein KFB95_04615 [Simkaniaceae bacterium]